MRYKPYPKYKASGVEWLGEIPEGWEVSPIKRFSTIVYGIGEPPVYQPEGVPLIRATNVSSGKVLDENLVFVNPEDIPEKRIIWLQANDIIVVRSGAYTGDSAIIPKKWAGSIAGFDMVLRVKDYEPEFLQYQLLAQVVKGFQIGLLKQRAAQPHLNSEEIGGCVVTVPPLPTQRTIAAFLDTETARIDGLIKDYEDLIELLKEKRQALISRAVTRGLSELVSPDDPEFGEWAKPVKFKDSGVEWIGEIPEGWKCQKLTQIARLESGHTPSRQHPEWWIPEECVFPWISLSDVHLIRDGKSEVISETAEKVSEIGLANSSARLLPQGTVILSRTASVGFSCVMGCSMATTQDFANWVCGDELYNFYLLYTLRSMKTLFSELMFGSTHNTIYMPDIISFRVPVPPLKEQQKIVDYIRKKIAEMDTLVSEAESAIELLKEHRSALITNAVTGKINVEASA